MPEALSTPSKSAALSVSGLWGLALTLPRKALEELADYVLTYANDTELAPSEFYDQVRGELERRRLPGLTLTEVEHAEGGVGSARRRYLRLARDRVYFDLCAAPFGAAFSFPTERWCGCRCRCG